MYHALRDPRYQAVEAQTDEPRSRWHGHRPVVASDIVGELDGLIKLPHFGKFDYRSRIDTFDFNEAFQSIECTAPVWHSLLVSLLSNQRSHRPSYAGTDEGSPTVTKRMFMVTTMVCHARAKKQSTAFTSMLHTYLHGSGLKRRALEVLSGLGICLSYHTGNRLMAGIAEEAKVRGLLSIYVAWRHESLTSSPGM